MPKKPKQSASLEVWKNWERRKKESTSRNNKRESDWKKAIRKIETDKKAKASLISRNR